MHTWLRVGIRQLRTMTRFLVSMAHRVRAREGDAPSTRWEKRATVRVRVRNIHSMALWELCEERDSCSNRWSLQNEELKKRMRVRHTTALSVEAGRSFEKWFRGEWPLQSQEWERKLTRCALWRSSRQWYMQPPECKVVIQSAIYKVRMQRKKREWDIPRRRDSIVHAPLPRQ